MALDSTPRYASPMTQDIPLFPLIGCDTGTSPNVGAVLLRLLYASPGDPFHSGLMHSMTAEQARELAAELLSAASTLRPLMDT